MADESHTVFCLFNQAAHGSLEAQRALVEMAFELASTESDPSVTLIEGLTFARLAAAHGDPHDLACLVMMLGVVLSRPEPIMDVAELMAETIARVEMLADSGEDLAAIGLNDIVGKASPETTERARWYSTKLAQANFATEVGER
jgi:hypothetical protein